MRRIENIPVEIRASKEWPALVDTWLRGDLDSVLRRLAYFRAEFGARFAQIASGWITNQVAKHERQNV